MKSVKWQWIVKGIAFGVLVISALTFVTMWLWNTLAAALFGLPVIGFFQALGLMVLGRLLSGGLGPRGWHGGSGRWGGHYWRERWQNMSEEERQKYMQRWGRHRCGPDYTQDSASEQQA